MDIQYKAEGQVYYGLTESQVYYGHTGLNARYIMD